MREIVLQRLGAEHFEEPFGSADAGPRLLFTSQPAHRFLVEKPPKNRDVRLILWSIHGQLVSKKIEWICDQNGQIRPSSEMELACRTGRHVGRRESRASRQQIHLPTLPLEKSHWYRTWLRQLVHSDTDTPRIGHYGFERPPGHEQIQVSRHYLLTKKASVGSHRAPTNDDKLDPEPGQHAEQVDVVVYS